MDSHNIFLTVCEKIVEKGVYFIAKFFLTGIAASGQYLAASQSPGFIYVSSNYGTNWTQASAPSGNWAGIATSSSGQYLAASQSPGCIYVSSNYGANWTQASAPSSNWDSVAISSNGTQIVAAQNGGGIWIAS